MDEAASIAPADQWRRHPADLARLVVAGVVLLVALAIAAVYPSVVRGVSADLVRLVTRLPRIVRSAIVATLQIVAVVAPVTLAVVLGRRRRFKLLGVITVAAGVAAVIMVLLQGWLDETVPPQVWILNDAESVVGGASFPSGTYLAALVATVVVTSTVASTSWTRWMWAGVGLAAVSRLVTAVAIPLNVAVTISLGAVVGSAVLYAFRAPVRQIAVDDVVRGLARTGLRATHVERGDHGSMFDEFRAEVVSPTDRVGEPPPVAAEVFVIDRHDRNADLMFRTFRKLRMKGIEDRRVSWNPSTVVEHAALCMSLASTVARTQPVLGVGATDAGDAILAIGARTGTALADLDPDRVDDAVLRAVWDQVAALQRRRLAHRNLHAGRLRVELDVPTGPAVTITGYDSALPGASDRELSADVAEVLVGLAAIVGAERAVQAAVSSSLPVAALAGALPLLQPLALTTVTRKRAGSAKALTAEVRSLVEAATGTADVPLVELERVSVSKVVGVLGLFMIVSVVLSFIANASGIADALRDASWGYLVPMLAMVVFGFMAGAWALMGAVTSPLPFFRTTTVMFAQSFLNRFTPANAGGMALRARYLQLNGVDLTSSATAVGLTSGASGVMQVVLLAGFFLWTGSSGSLGISLPKASTLAVVVLVVLGLAGAVYVTPWGRKLLVGKVRPALATAWHDLRELARRPAKLFALFGGATLGKLTAIYSFRLATLAFGIDLGFPRTGLLFMTAGTIASAAPTPGGVGAIEAALTAALTSAGVDPALALSTVLVYRLISYWLPVLPCWVALNHLRRTGVV